jgi:hypothetical protein
MDCRVFVVYEGMESHEGIEAHARASLDEVRALVKDGLTLAGGRRVRFRLFASGDLPFISALLGLSSVRHTWGCLWCELNLEDLQRDTSKQGAARTFQGLHRASHCPGVDFELPFDCPCGVTVETRVADAHPIRSAPADAHAKAHHGSRHGCAPHLRAT